MKCSFILNNIFQCLQFKLKNINYFRAIITDDTLK